MLNPLKKLVQCRFTVTKFVVLSRWIFLFSFLLVDLKATQKMSLWRESINFRSGEKGIAFTIQDVGVLDSLHVKGLNTGRWTYLITLKGAAAERYDKNKITIFNPAALKSKGKESVDMKIEYGEISVDYKKSVVTITLRVWKNDVVVDFEGNGKYTIERSKP
jgi:hypothetical protein